MEALVIMLLKLVIIGVILGLLWAAVDYFKCPEPFAWGIKAAIGLVALIVLVVFLLALMKATTYVF